MKLFLNEISLNSIHCRKTFLGGRWPQVPLSAVSLNIIITIIIISRLFVHKLVDVF